MNTNTQTVPEVKPAVTEADVVAFLKSKSVEIRDALKDECAKAGVEAARVMIFPHNESLFDIYCYDSDCKSINGTGATIEAAMTEFRARLAKRIPQPAALRAQAAELLAKADALETSEVKEAA